MTPAIIDITQLRMALYKWFSAQDWTMQLEGRTTRQSQLQDAIEALIPRCPILT